ncbi:choice-of-anchor D domain-containing protein [Acidicapsa acidisoli]|uniref:choice-of-anchor D domain-containing protein n=1 Tax=Acidicapsa acidisoli TaxID=1615681 RepID=UPI0021DFDE7D|nr:choice-of-anchor D domain-containing protein [Acidicapsa acidisoli]
MTPVLPAVATILVFLPLVLRADNRTYTLSGGTFVAGTAVGQTIAVKGAPLSSSGAVLAFSCPITTYGAGTYQVNWTCQGGAISIVTQDKSLSFTGQFVSGSMELTATGGGRGSRLTESYRFAGEFSGIVTANGVTQRSYGSVEQLVQSGSIVGLAGAPVTSGSFGWNSAYSPLLVGDNTKGRVVASDNITGANLTAYGSMGRATGQFTAISGIAEDPSGRIYILDSVVDRVVRIDDLTGKNWVEIGGYGIGADHFNAPSGLAVDAAGKIWVADSGNNRIVRFDDMLGTNWTSFGSAGSGKNQFINPIDIALDAQGMIYVADAGNNRVVRFSDLKGTNWASLSEVLSGTTAYLLTTPKAVAVGPGGNVYIALGGTSPSLIETSFPSRAGSTISTWSNPITSISLDRAGTIYVAGEFTPGLAQINDAAATGYFGSALGGAVPRSGPVYARPSTTPPPAAPLFSASALNFGNRNVGEPSAPYVLGLANLGATALTIDSISASADFPLAKNCPASLAGGASCPVAVQFDPKATGPRPSELVLTSSGVHPSLDVALSGVGTTPTAVVLPASLLFISQQLGSSSGASEVTLSNTGSGPLTITSIAVSGQFAETNNCGKTLTAGGGCTINVSFKPTTVGADAGLLTISDDAVSTGAHQVISLSGTGIGGPPSVGLSPESLQFPDQEIGTTSVKQVITLTNVSTAALTLGKPTFPTEFKVTSTCGATLAKGASCAFSVSFAPQVTGAIAGALTLPIAGQPTLSITLSGTGSSAGKGAVLKFTPSAVNFGPVAVGEDVSQTVTVTNTSGLPTAIQSSALTATGGLTLTHNTCPAILAGLGSCSVTIQFVPSSVALSFSGTFTVIEGSGAKIVATITGQSVVNGN